jgi:hypothetical protein
MELERFKSLPEDVKNTEASFSIRPEDKSPWGYTINEALRKLGRPERFRVISNEAGIIAEGIWTTEEALRISGGITLEVTPGGGEYFHPSPDDFEFTGETENGYETFKVEPELVKLLIDNGVFRRKPYGAETEKKYMLFYPPGDYAKKGVFVEMMHEPSGDEFGRELITLHFMI